MPLPIFLAGVFTFCLDVNYLQIVFLKNCLLIFLSFCMSHIVLQLQTEVLNELEDEGEIKCI